MGNGPVRISRKASISLQTMTQTLEPNNRLRAAARPAGAVGETALGAPAVEEARARVIVETKDAEKTGNELDAIGASRVHRVSQDFISAEIPVAKAAKVYERTEVTRMQTLKRKQLMMDKALLNGEVMGPAGRLVPQTGAGTLVAIVDTGYDLSHPMFRDASGNLRVDGLLDQTRNDREFTKAQLESGWANGRNPGRDEHGHGTHVATIAAGSKHLAYAGVAPGSRMLLVKSDFVDLAGAASWIFQKAAGKPCVVNFSLGHHYGSHDGTDQEERALMQLSGAGRIVVAAAGNERNDNIHIGLRFSNRETETAVFDIAHTAGDRPFAVITLWHHHSDKFELSVASPSGATMAFPPIDQSVTEIADGAQVELSRQRYTHNGLIQGQIQVSFSTPFVPPNALRGWKLVATCRRAATGRLDGWFHNSGFGEFRPGAMLEAARTVGMPATGKAVLAVASHVSKNRWPSDRGPQSDLSAVVGRSSSFSSRGPSRDGKSKPEISAPGQYLTAALAAGSELESLTGRAHIGDRLLSIEGTSMASPFTAGIVSLMLEARPTLTAAQIRSEFEAHGVKDVHTGSIAWTPDYGFGKVSAAALLGAAAVPGVIAVAAARGAKRKPARAAKRKARQPA